MGVFSYRIVREQQPATEGTDYSGHFGSPEQLAVWYRAQVPDAVKVAVWEGEPCDRPVDTAALVGVS